MWSVELIESILPVPCVPVPMFQHKKSGKEPKAAAELVLGGTSYKTKVCFRM